ncbi:MAG: DUF899 domain-containing protein [Deltaproteobacteria bacterium]|nr:DUF899 domain-containing protein [Deltaproteobacteria bacterium]
MSHPKIVSKEEWLRERTALLAKEKAFAKERDALSAARRELPMVKVTERYDLEGPSGPTTLRDLFAGRRQLVVYHFMFDPSWEEGCKSCSLVSDHLERAVVHLAARDVSFAAVSRAPIAKLVEFEKRMGWTFPWYSSFASSFNYDFGVSFRESDRVDGLVPYNYGRTKFGMSEAPGLSVFLEQGNEVFHTYSTYARGLDLLIGTYNVLDLTPLGRQEEGLPYGMSWVRHRDKYAAT